MTTNLKATLITLLLGGIAAGGASLLGADWTTDCAIGASAILAAILKHYLHIKLDGTPAE